MATKQQKEELIDILKGNKKRYEIHLTGYGGEIVLGTVTQEQYEYWSENEADFEEHCNDWDNELGVSDDLIIVRDGSWHDVDNLAHETGCEFSNACWVTVYDEDNNEVWSSPLDHEALENKGVDTEGFATDEYNVEFDSDVEYGFMGQSVEKGTFFTGEFETFGDFNPKKLSFSYIDIEGWTLINGVSYESEIVDDTGGYSTTGKGLYFKVFKVER
jgi:hypothetical protein